MLQFKLIICINWNGFLLLLLLLALVLVCSHVCALCHSLPICFYRNFNVSHSVAVRRTHKLERSFRAAPHLYPPHQITSTGKRSQTHRQNILRTNRQYGNWPHRAQIPQTQMWLKTTVSGCTVRCVSRRLERHQPTESPAQLNPTEMVTSESKSKSSNSQLVYAVSCVVYRCSRVCTYSPAPVCVRACGTRDTPKTPHKYTTLTQERAWNEGEPATNEETCSHREPHDRVMIVWWNGWKFCAQET